VIAFTLMKRVSQRMFSALLLALCVTTAVSAQDEKAHHQSMEVAGGSMKVLQEAVKTGDGATVAKEAKKIAEAFPGVVDFWTAKKSEVGMKSSKDSVAALKALADAGAAGADAQTLQARMKEVGATCRTCHTQHREKNAEGKYIFKY
jgi:cytochrome c556